MKTCPHPACNEPVEGQYFACKDHWFSLPRPVRLAILKARGAMSNRITHSGYLALRDAQNAAIEFFKTTP